MKVYRKKIVRSFNTVLEKKETPIKLWKVIHLLNKFKPSNIIYLRFVITFYMFFMRKDENSQINF